MPKIHLKPNSPEFADPQEEIIVQTCEMPGCNAEACFKAPKHRGLNEYHFFCLEHVQEYNKAWDFFSGMAEQEVEDHIINSNYGFRPTWRYDTDANSEEILRSAAWKTYHFTDEEPPKGDAHKNAYFDGANSFDKHSPEFEALAIMGLAPPVTLDEIKKHYKVLVKKHHPDLNKGCKKSEDLLKRVNMAYTILKMAYAEFDKLQKRN